ncbi:chorismate-binding protein [Nocardioides sp.]|uniref:anthranilate synthase family protein n=1 Tax=Nocardioides sp. TaxID=35761 RepID=UPI00286DDABF|nr:chorismate-binding protein [Nocardioides sp.]
MTAAGDVHALLEQVQGQQAWAVIRRKAAPTAGIIGGTRSEVESILDIPLEDGVPEPGRSADRLVAVPFRQIAERGFDVIDDGTPLVVVDITEEHEVGVEDLIAALPDVPVEFADRGGFVIDDEDYATIVERIISDEIGQGEGANLVIGRHYRAVVADWDAERALTVFRRLLVRERGAYWTFIFFTGDRFLIGASPERHVSVKAADDGAERATSERPSRLTGVSDVRMNPISGTFRVGRGGDEEELKERLLEFLADEKEIFELFMVVDEELKMMCDICHEGGQVLGPFLKPMTHLVHTEYLLAGRSERDPREILRDTMYAATVTGAPVENACRLISAYETEGRGYYGSALALFGRDKQGNHTMDSPILIRTADVSPQGDLKVTAGATLVRDSNAAYEVAETHAKAGGILSAFGLVPVATVDGDAIAALARDEDVLLALGTRNQRLSRFWLTDQEGAPPDPTLKGKRVVILHGEDDFVNMLRHVLGVFGMTSTVVRHEDYTTAAFDGADLVIVGPGPGDPRDGAHPKIATFRTAVDDLLASGQPFLAVCLGHQTLCDRLGIPLAFKDIVFQGTQSRVPYRGRTERVGFYNTFVGRVTDPGVLPEGVTVERDEATGDVHLVAGPHYRGIQFHAESILTEHGYDLIHDLAQALVGNSGSI